MYNMRTEEATICLPFVTAAFRVNSSGRTKFTPSKNNCKNCNTRIFHLNQSEPTNSRKDTTLSHQKRTNAVPRNDTVSSSCSQGKDWTSTGGLEHRRAAHHCWKTHDAPVKLAQAGSPGLQSFLRSWDVNGSSSAHMFFPISWESAEEEFHYSSLALFAFAFSPFLTFLSAPR